MFSKNNMEFNKKLTFSLLLFLPVIFMFFFGRYGLEDSDSGFLVGMGWRIINGELPYRDFYYIRPPLSAYISAFFLYVTPEVAQVFWLRLINYYQLLFQVVLTLVILRKFYNFEELGLDFNFFSILCFLVTSLGTLYFQWHTTDGIFFAVLGFYIAVVAAHKFPSALIFAGLMFGLAAMTKQNFLLVPVTGLAFVFFQYGFKRFLYCLGGLVLAFSLLGVFLHSYDLYDLYVEQTTGSTKLIDLFIAGFAIYFYAGDFLFPYLIFVLMLYFFLSVFILKSESVATRLLVSAVVGVAALNTAGFVFYKNDAFLIPFFRVLSIALFIFFIWLLCNNKENIRKHYLVLGLLSVSWASSISWGGMSPLMYFTPVMFFVYYLLKENFDISGKAVSIAVVAPILFYAFIVNSKPYRDEFTWRINNDGGLISSKLNNIKVNDILFQKHLELHGILSRYEKSTILPSMPGAHYLHGKRNYFVVDWAMDVEAAYPLDRLVFELEKCCDYVIVEKRHFGQPIGTSGKFYSSITNYVISNYKVVNDQYEYFDVYVK